MTIQVVIRGQAKTVSRSDVALDGKATAATTSLGNVICATAWPLAER